MLPTGFFAVAVGVVFLVLIAVASMRQTRTGRRRLRDPGALLPLDDPGDGFGK
ncbi:MAG: hypothetical protein ACREH4_15560 [Vitreimonas sp.]